MKITTSVLAGLLSDIDGVLSRESDTIKQFSAVAADKEQTISAASGADDQRALEKLNALASREALLNRQRSLLAQQKTGLTARLLDEAARVREVVSNETRARHAALAGEVRSALAGFYPGNPKRLQQAVREIVQGSLEAPVFTALTKASLRHYVFDARNQQPADYARAILGAAERALVLLAEK